MKSETSVFTLRTRNGGDTPPVLTSVHARGRLDGLLFEMTLKQVYRNTSNRVLEVVYTFPPAR